MSDTFNLDELDADLGPEDFGDAGARDPLAGHGLYERLFSDADTAALFTDHAEVEALIAVEAALARVQGRLGVIPADAGMRIDGVLTTQVIDPATLTDGTASAESGLATPTAERTREIGSLAGLQQDDHDQE